MAVALTSNGKNYDNNEIIVAALSSYFNKPFVIPSFTTIDLTPEELDPFLGEYSAAGFPLKINITKDNATLFAQATGQSAFPLEPIKKNTFQFLAAGITIEFNPNEKQLIIKQGGGAFTLNKK